MMCVIYLPCSNKGHGHTKHTVYSTVTHHLKFTAFNWFRTIRTGYLLLQLLQKFPCIQSVANSTNRLYIQVEGMNVCIVLGTAMLLVTINSTLSSISTDVASSLPLPASGLSSGKLYCETDS